MIRCPPLPRRSVLPLAVLSGMDGFEVCRRIRAQGDIAVIMLTARGDDFDVVTGLEAGADDYVVKPVQPTVLDARIRAVGQLVGVESRTPTIANPRSPSSAAQWCAGTRLPRSGTRSWAVTRATVPTGRRTRVHDVSQACRRHADGGPPRHVHLPDGIPLKRSGQWARPRGTRLSLKVMITRRDAAQRLDIPLEMAARHGLPTRLTEAQLRELEDNRHRGWSSPVPTGPARRRCGSTWCATSVGSPRKPGRRSGGRRSPTSAATTTSTPTCRVRTPATSVRRSSASAAGVGWVDTPLG